MQKKAIESAKTYSEQIIKYVHNNSDPDDFLLKNGDIIRKSYEAWLGNQDSCKLALLCYAINEFNKLYPDVLKNKTSLLVAVSIDIHHTSWSEKFNALRIKVSELSERLANTSGKKFKEQEEFRQNLLDGKEECGLNNRDFGLKEVVGTLMYCEYLVRSAAEAKSKEGLSLVGKANELVEESRSLITSYLAEETPPSYFPLKFVQLLDTLRWLCNDLLNRIKKSESANKLRDAVDGLSNSGSHTDDDPLKIQRSQIESLREVSDLFAETIICTPDTRVVPNQMYTKFWPVKYSSDFIRAMIDIFAYTVLPADE